MINFYKIPNSKIIISIFHLFIRLIPRDTVVYILQGRLRGKKWIIGSSQNIFWLGSFEYRKQILFSKLIPEGAIVYDIGAHVGFYTLLASVLVGPRGRVFAFEPLPRNINYLKKHLTLNSFDNVTVIEAAVSDKDGYGFLIENIDSGFDRLAKEGTFKVKTISLDNSILRNEISPPDFIKIDAEGEELQILNGARETLIKYNPAIFLATHGLANYNQCCAFLKSIGYDFKIIYENELFAFKGNKYVRDNRYF